jgi:hypothetical protein
MNMPVTAPVARLRSAPLRSRSHCAILAALLVAAPSPSWFAAAQSGTIVDVSTVAQLQAAVTNLASGMTIRIAPGRYALTRELRIRNGVRHVAAH